MPLIVADRGAIAYARELSATLFGERRAHAFAGTTPFDVGQGCVRSQYLRLDLWVFSDDPKETVLFVSDSSREKDSVSEREKIPQAVKLERCTIGAH